MPTITSAVATPTSEQLRLTAEGKIAQAFPVSLTTLQAIPTANAASGLLVASLVGIAGGTTVTNLITAVAVAGTALSFAKLGLLDSSGNFLAATASASATFNSGTGYRSIALTTPYVVPVSGGYYVCYLQYGSGATGATLYRGTTQSLGMQIGTAARPYAQVTNQTDISGNVTLADATSSYWFAVS